MTLQHIMLLNQLAILKALLNLTRVGEETELKEAVARTQETLDHWND